MIARMRIVMTLSPTTTILRCNVRKQAPRKKKKRTMQIITNATIVNAVIAPFMSRYRDKKL